LAVFAGILLVFGASRPAEATTYITTELGAAGPANFAILGLGGVNVAMTDEVLNGPGQTIGNVGVASSGNIAINSSTPPAITGNLYLGNTATTSGSACAIPPNACGQVGGTVFTNQDAFLGTSGPAGNTNPALATGAVQQAMQAYVDFNALTVDNTITGNITSSQTLSCTAAQTLDGKCVIAVTGNIQLGNNDILTLLGTSANESFILEVAGTISLNGGNNFSGGQIRLGGTLDSPDDAVIKVQSVSGGDNVTASGGSSQPCNATSYANLGTLAPILCPGGIGSSTNTLPNAFIQGILLDLQGGVGFSPGMVIGEIIGGGNEIRLVSGSQVIAGTTTVPPTTTTIPTGSGGTSGQTVPEPSSLVLFATGMGLAAKGLRRRKN